MPKDNLVIISDTHIAKIWDKIDAIIPKKYYFLNPNRFLRKIVASTKKSQTLIINGDLIDYYYADYIPNLKTNWEIFFSILSKSKAKYFLNLGNHDYRRYPYNFSIYHLEHVNLTNPVRRKYANAIGHNSFRFFDEVKSVRVNEHNPGTLAEYPFKQFYSQELNDYSLIFLDTGPDEFAAANLVNPFHFTRFRHVIWPGWWHMVQTRGLTKTQLEFLEKQLAASKRDIILFMHCPIVFSFGDMGNKDIFSISKKAITKEFFKILLKSEKNIIIVTSHFDLPKQFILDRKTKVIRDCDLADINEKRWDAGYIKFICTLPIGTINKKNTKIGSLHFDKKIYYKVLHDFNENYLLPL